MSERSTLLRGVMAATGTSQTVLARRSGVSQPRISQLLSGRVTMSDAMLGRLLECMEYRLEVVRCAVPGDLTPVQRVAWRRHRVLAEHLTAETLRRWLPSVRASLDRQRDLVGGDAGRVDRWQRLVDDGDLAALRHAMSSLDRGSVWLRESSPFAAIAAGFARWPVRGPALPPA